MSAPIYQNCFLENFYLAAPGPRCMWDLLVVALGSSSLIRDQTQAPCIGSVESQMPGHQRHPPNFAFNININ